MAFLFSFDCDSPADPRLARPHSAALLPHALDVPSGRMRHVREVGAYNLPLRALFDKDQGCSAIGGYRLAVPGGAPEHVVSIHYPHRIVVNAAGWLPKAEAG